MDKGSNFVFPELYSLPPFYTIQPNLDTRKQQLQLWGTFILDYTRHHKIYELDVLEASSTSPLFNNKTINSSWARLLERLSPEAVRIVLEPLVARGNAKWLDKDKKRVQIIWRTDEEWAHKAIDSMLIDTVCTVYELRESDTVENEEFYMLDIGVFMRALQILQKKGLASIFTGTSKENVGVKFFAKTM